jgi:cell division protein FtsB
MHRSNLARRPQSLLACECDDPDAESSSTDSDDTKSDDTKNGYSYKPLNALTLQKNKLLQSPQVQGFIQSPQVQVLLQHPNVQVLLRKANLMMILFGVTFVMLYMNAGLRTQALTEQVSALQSENNGLRQSLKVTALEYENKGLRQGLQVAQKQAGKALAPVKKGVAAVAAKAVARSPAVTTKTNKAVAVSPSSAVSTKTKSGLEPIACQDFIDGVKAGTYKVAVKDPNMKKGRFTRRTITENPFWISVHHEKFDPTRWTIYQKGRYYEHSLAKIWTDILRQATPGSRVLDVGYVTIVAVFCFIILVLLLCHRPQVILDYQTTSRLTIFFFSNIITVATLATTH